MTRPSRLNLAKQADVILKRAGCDATGAKKDKSYQRQKRAKAKWLRRCQRAKAKKFGKLGAASPVKIIPANGC